MFVTSQHADGTVWEKRDAQPRAFAGPVADCGRKIQGAKSARTRHVLFQVEGRSTVGVPAPGRDFQGRRLDKGAGGCRVPALHSRGFRAWGSGTLPQGQRLAGRLTRMVPSMRGGRGPLEENAGPPVSGPKTGPWFDCGTGGGAGLGAGRVAQGRAAPGVKPIIHVHRPHLCRGKGEAVRSSFRQRREGRRRGFPGSGGKISHVEAG